MTEHGSVGRGTVRIAVVSDTHLPRGDRVLPPALLEECAAADLILHAGDVVRGSVLDELEAYGRVLGVRGNGDGPELWSRLPQTRTIELAGTRIGMIHDAGRAEGRPARLAALFPGCHVIVFGHSHVPLVDRHDGPPPAQPRLGHRQAAAADVHHGAPGRRRRQGDGRTAALAARAPRQ
jgi:putative phosphoesterase